MNLRRGAALLSLPTYPGRFRMLPLEGGHPSVACLWTERQLLPVLALNLSGHFLAFCLYVQYA